MQETWFSNSIVSQKVHTMRDPSDRSAHIRDPLERKTIRTYPMSDFFILGTSNIDVLKMKKIRHGRIYSTFIQDEYYGKA